MMSLWRIYILSSQNDPFVSLLMSMWFSVSYFNMVGGSEVVSEWVDGVNLHVGPVSYPESLAQERLSQWEFQVDEYFSRKFCVTDLNSVTE